MYYFGRKQISECWFIIHSQKRIDFVIITRKACAEGRRSPCTVRQMPDHRQQLPRPTTVECHVVKYNMWAFPVHLSLCGAALLPNLMLGCSVVKAADCGGARCKGTP